MKIENALPPKGTRDFGPDTMAKRTWIIERIREKFQKFGFVELQTPALENLKVLLGKYGMEGEKLLYKVLNSGPYLRKGQKDEVAVEAFQNGEKELTPLISEKGLRYDLTVPFARYVALNHRELNFPFKRFQIQPVWRADRPQKGRFREFWQCDADIVGSSAPSTDAEMILLTQEVMESLGIGDYTIRINNRKVLNGICQAYCPDAPADKVIGTLDKLDKIGKEKVLEELRSLGLSPESTAKFSSYLKLGSESGNAIEELSNLALKNAEFREGLDETKMILDLSASSGDQVKFDPNLARGLDYYTGSIFEVVAKASGIGSLSGGGRYDDLTGVFGVSGIPGVGISYGLDRIYEYLESNEGFPENLERAGDFMICHIDEDSVAGAWKLWQELRTKDLRGFMYPEASKLKKQFQYADKASIPYVIVVGPDEIRSGKYQLKHLGSGKQESLTPDEIFKSIIKGE